MVLIHYFKYWRCPCLALTTFCGRKSRNKVKASWEAKNLKRQEKRELDKQGKPSIIHSIILYYFSNINF